MASLKQYRQEQLEAELAELESKQVEEAAEAEEVKKIETPVEDPEEDTFRKRYGDLRRHSQKREQELQAEIQALKQAQNKVEFPKTEEEVEAWKKRYPDLYGILETLILKTATTERESVNQRLAEVDQLKAQIREEKARAQLVAAHPDFIDIAKTKEFHEWLEGKSEAIRRVMYEPGQDVNDAIDIVTMYKQLTGTKTKKPSGKAEAARSVSQSSRAIPSSDGGKIWTESEVAKMSEREYRQNESEIAKQISSGKFVYDLSGAAR